jgi:hypothetical protein
LERGKNEAFDSEIRPFLKTSLFEGENNLF